jgi:SNF2 family DNA or RNA helicase
MSDLKPYPFQTELVEKLSKQPNVLIGDDMGLGKTVECILLDKVRREYVEGKPYGRPGKTLVLTPASVISSWEDHYATWAPSLKVKVIDRTNPPKSGRDAFVKSIQDGTHDVYIMHWDALRLIIDDVKNIQFLHVIADEVHKIKNRKAQVNQAANKLRTKYKTGASGTAADNSPEDLWGPLNWLWPGKWRSYWNYYNKHVLFKAHDTDKAGCSACLLNDEVKVHKVAYREVIGVGEKEELHRQMAPFYMRRRKEEVLKDLPDKYYTEIEVELHSQQRRAYDQMQQRMLAWVGEHEDQPLAAPVVIAQLVRLQQFAVGYGELEWVEKKHPESGQLERKPLLRLTEPSSKLDAVMELLEDTNEQLVVFSQSKQAIKMLGARLEKNRIPYGLLTGDTPQNDRGTLVQNFQSGRLRVFAGTVSAGGIGITLTAASTVVFLDRPWSPSVARQAEDRLHRIGQKNAVQVIDLIARNTIDLGRLQKIEAKWGYIKELLGDPKEVKKKLKRDALNNTTMTTADMARLREMLKQ